MSGGIGLGLCLSLAWKKLYRLSSCSLPNYRSRTIRFFSIARAPFLVFLSLGVINGQVFQ